MALTYSRCGLLSSIDNIFPEATGARKGSASAAGGVIAAGSDRGSGSDGSWRGCGGCALARGKVEAPGPWHKLGPGPWSLHAVRSGPAGARTAPPDRAHRAAAQARDQRPPQNDLRGTVRRRHPRPLRPPPGAPAKPRLQNILRHLGLALRGRLLTPGSKHTWLRTVRARAPATRPTPRGIGIDAGARQRGHRYGGIVCDLERREILDILPDREAATVEAWLADRLRGRDCLERPRRRLAPVGRPRGAESDPDRRSRTPDGNASRAFLDVARRSMIEIRRALGAGLVKPDSGTPSCGPPPNGSSTKASFVAQR